MKNKSLKEILNGNDVKESAFNFTLVWGVGQVASVICNGFFNFELNKYHSIEHLAIGAGIGTLSYRKAGKGFKGVVAGLLAGTFFNLGWEGLESTGKIYYPTESQIDTITDIGVIYEGNILGFLGEGIKTYINFGGYSE